MQAWRDAIANVKAQIGHQNNRLMNAEVGEVGLGGLWLQQNTIVEQITKRYAAETDTMNRAIRETNKARQAMQVKAYPELKKLHHKRETALQRKFMCQQAYGRVKSVMLGEQFDVFVYMLVEPCIACSSGCVRTTSAGK